LLSSLAAAEPSVATFTLRDHLDRQWQNELVVFPVSKDVFGRGDLALVGPDGPVAHQWVPADLAPSGKPSVVFLATVPAFGEAAYRLVKGKPIRKSGITASLDGDTAYLDNGVMGISVGGKDAATRGPIDTITQWAALRPFSGRLDTPKPPTDVSVRILANGPVFAEAAADYTFPDNGFWRLRFRIIDSEPVVLVDEKFQLPPGAKYTLAPRECWLPEQLFHRDNGNRCRVTDIDAVKGDVLFSLQPWPQWWGEPLKGNWLGLPIHSGLLAVGVREPGAWVSPGRTKWDASISVDRTLSATFQLQGFERKWVLVSLLKEEAVQEKQLGQRATPLPQQYVIKYGEFPLDLVKDYVLSWDDGATRHPRLFTTEAELERFRGRYAVDEAQLARLRKARLHSFALDDTVAAFLATGDRELGRKLAEFAMAGVQKSLDGYVRQEQLRNPGSCPHHRNPTLYGGAITADLALQPGVLTAEERARLKAQLAFLGYTLARPMIISPERGFRANPNMTSMARGMLGVVACTIPNHPRAAEWGKVAIAELKHELEEWCGPNGGWLEAPHYATASLDALISLALASRGTGFSETDWQFHPKIRAAVAWLAKISTPPDPRLDGRRHMPAIGNSYLGEPTCLPGWMATIWSEKDPAFSQEMQWHWQAHGMPRTPGIGGAYPGLFGYRHLMLDESLPSRQPTCGSALFPEAGAVFRAHFPGPHETYLHYIQGRMHQHYDYDEGSFILWGKGRPLCEEFGYYGRAPAADHSRIDDGFPETLGAEGRIREFAAGDGADYLRGERGGWHRQILFVKDADPLGPNYFLIRDTVLSGRKFDWRVWIATDESPDVAPNPLRAKGRFESDLVVFFLEPAKRSVTTDKATRTAGTAGWGHKNRTTTQRCLQMKRLAGDQPVSVVLYPVLKDQPTPTFTALCGGRAVKIAHASGTDYAVLAREPFEFEEDGIAFEGKAGAVQVRKGGTRLSLPRKGRLSHRGQSIAADAEPERTVSRAFPQ
jgi:hypothetical protein